MTTFHLLLLRFITVFVLAQILLQLVSAIPIMPPPQETTTLPVVLPGFQQPRQRYMDPGGYIKLESTAFLTRNRQVEPTPTPNDQSSLIPNNNLWNYSREYSLWPNLSKILLSHPESSSLLTTDVQRTRILIPLPTVDNKEAISHFFSLISKLRSVFIHDPRTRKVFASWLSARPPFTRVSPFIMPKHNPIKPKPGHGYPLYNPREYEEVKDVAVKALREYQEKFVQPQVLPSASAPASKVGLSGFGVLVPGPPPPSNEHESFQPPPQQASAWGSNHVQDSSTGEYHWPEFNPSPRYH